MLEQHTFAGTAFADDGGDFTFINLQIDLIQDRPAAKFFGHISKFD
jgi:hypothetical protein